jgi:hypothetical protein
LLDLGSTVSKNGTQLTSLNAFVNPNQTGFASKFPKGV